MPGYELIDEEEKKQVLEVLDRGILARYGFDKQREGVWKSKELEKAISTYLKVSYAHVVSSGTAALTTALVVMGIGAGDEVIMPCFTFIATFEAVLSVGAVPILVDIDHSLTLCPVAVGNAITNKTRAILPVHMCGAMANMEALLHISKTHHIPIIEDACQSFGASYKGRYVGTIGQIGCFSYDFVKTITCGEAGAVVTNSKDLYTKADVFADHGHDHLGVDRGADLHPFLGYNYRINELNAAIGVAQIKKIDTILSIQRKNYAIFQKHISTIKQVKMRTIYDEEGNSATFFAFFLPNVTITNKVISALQAKKFWGGCFYYYDNLWHYIRKWDHVKNAKSLNPLPFAQKQILQQIKETTFHQSDTILSCCIVQAIQLSWQDQEVEEKAKVMADTIKEFV